VTCRDHLGQTVPDHRCHPSGRPDYSQICRSDPCPTTSPLPEKTYKWRTAHWTTVGTTVAGQGPVEEKLSVSTPSSLSAPTHYSLTSTGVSSFRAVTFDWDRHSNPASGTSTFQPTPQMLPMTLPQIPTYAYFANYFRFDSLPVETRHKPD